MIKEKFHKIVVWCKEADLFAQPDRPVRRAVPPCVKSAEHKTPCGQALCTPMQNYLRDYQ